MTDFITRDSGERTTFDSGMQRDTSTGKPRYDLIPYEMLKRWADLYARGAEKYDERNWEKAGPAELIQKEATPELARFKESAFRHFVDWFYGKNGEEDHAAAVLWNVAAYEEIRTRLERKQAELDALANDPDFLTTPVDNSRFVNYVFDDDLGQAKYEYCKDAIEKFLGGSYL